MSKTCVIIGKFIDKSGHSHKIFESTEFGLFKQYRSADAFVKQVTQAYRKSGFDWTIDSITVG